MNDRSDVGKNIDKRQRNWVKKEVAFKELDKNNTLDISARDHYALQEIISRLKSTFWDIDHSSPLISSYDHLNKMPQADET